MIQRKDFILRLVEDFGTFLRKVFDTKKDDRHAAGLLVASAIQQLTTLNPELFEILDFQSSLRMIERHKALTAYECAILARLLVEKAEIAGDADLAKAQGFYALAKHRYLNPHAETSALLEFLKDILDANNP